MDISGPSPLEQLGAAAQVAVQANVLDTARTQGADLVNMIASAPVGSANMPWQGRHIDARA